MAVETIFITFDGYWRTHAIGGVPAQSGVYVVYDGKHNPNNTVDLRRVLYIGEADDVRGRIPNHERWADWRRALAAGGEVTFAFGPISAPKRMRTEAALIFEHKPPLNVEYKYSFSFDDTMVVLDGRASLLKPYFTVRRTSVRPDSQMKIGGHTMSQKPTRRHVVPHEGKWAVRAPGSERASSVHQTQAQAEARAKEIVANLGGGEVTTHRESGQIRDSDTVAPGPDPRYAKDTKH